MKKDLAISRLLGLSMSNRFRSICAFVAALVCFSGAASAQPAKKSSPKATIEDGRVNNQQEVIARLFAMVNELKGEADQPAAALLQSEVADVLWRFDEPAARSIFRLAFDTVRQPASDNSSALDAKAKREALNQSRRRTSAIKTILKRYGLRDRKGSEAWLQEFENEIKAEKTASDNSGRMSQEQAELMAEIALGLVSRDPKEAQRLGLRSLSAEQIPSAFGRLLMALRGSDKTLSDVLYRQAILTMTIRGFNYDKALLSLTNYQFFSDGRPFPDVSPVVAGLLIQFFVDAASAQAARLRSRSVRDPDEQVSMGRFYSFLTTRAMPIVALNSPDKLALLQTNVGELAQGLNAEQRQQAETLASMDEQRSTSSDGNGSDFESRIHRAEKEKNSSTRNLLLRNLVLSLMRSDPEKALGVALKIDDADVRGQTQDDVYLVLMQQAFRGGSYEEARKLALKMNDHDSQARWLAEIAGRVSAGSKDRTEAINLLSEAHSMAAKRDNTPAKLHSLLLIANEFVRLDPERGFNVLSDAVDTTNRLDTKAQTKPKYPPGPFIKVISISVVDGKEVSTDDRPTVNSIDFNQISAFAERDYLRTSALGGNIKDLFFRAKYFIALARSVLQVPRQGSGYERTLEDVLGN